MHSSLFCRFCPTKLLSKTAPFLVLGFLFTSTIFADAADAASTAAAEFKVPEAYAEESQHDYCLLRVNLTDSSASRRKPILIKFISDGFVYTSEWRKNFSVIGVDYVSFSFFHLLVNRSCGEALAVARQAVARFLPCVSPKEDLCGVATIIALGRKSPLIAPFTDAPAFGLLAFDKFIGRSQLQDCAVLIRLRPDSSGEGFGELDRSLFNLYIKFRMPIVDIKRINREVYLVFSRQCNKKSDYYSTLSELLNVGKNRPALFDGVNLAPDTSPYIFSEGMNR